MCVICNTAVNINVRSCDSHIFYCCYHHGYCLCSVLLAWQLSQALAVIKANLLGHSVSLYMCVCVVSCGNENCSLQLCGIKMMLLCIPNVSAVLHVRLHDTDSWRTWRRREYSFKYRPKVALSNKA